MAEELKQNLGAQVRLIAGGGGIFDVKLDGKPIFSKFNTGRFPEPGEVTKLIKSS